MYPRIINSKDQYFEYYEQFTSQSNSFTYFAGWPESMAQNHSNHPFVPEGVLLIVVTASEDPHSEILGVMELQFPSARLAAMYQNPEMTVGKTSREQPLIWFMGVDVVESARKQGVASLMYDTLAMLMDSQLKGHAIYRSEPGSDTPLAFTTWAGNRLRAMVSA